MHKFTIIQDSREQNPWDFSFYEKCKGVVVRKLETGDYSIEGLEDIVTIERKKSTGEMAINIGKDGRRFNKELVRMSQLKYKYLICEFSFDTLSNFPHGSTIPSYQWSKLRITPQYLVSRLLSYRDKYGIEVIFCNNSDEANEKAIEVLEYVYTNEMV